MNLGKQRMPSSYWAIFVFAIIMIFLVMIVGAATKSKSSGFGIWIWGYTAWLMYKRRFSDLVSFYKILLWFDGIALALLCLLALFGRSESEAGSYFSIGNGLILLAAVILVTYVLYRYFDRINKGYGPEAKASVTGVDFWEVVGNELKEGKRVDGLWTRAFAEAEGDTNKANAKYIKFRVEQLQLEESAARTERARSAEALSVSDSDSDLKRFWNSFNPIGKVGIVGIIILIGYFLATGTGEINYGSLTGKSSEGAQAIPAAKSSLTTPVYRNLADGSIKRWKNDIECFLRLDNVTRNLEVPVSIRRTAAIGSVNYRELIKDDRLVAVVYFDSSIAGDILTEIITRELFLRIERECE
jgi:hypothetical protein